MKHILVVDDDENLRLVLEETLLSCDYHVDTAESGAVALEMVKNKNYDLTITDLMMPGIKGIELIQETRKFNTSVGFLVISAYGTIETAVEAMQEGAFDFITKPFSISHIESRVARYFEYKTLQDENRSLKQQLNSLKQSRKIIGEGQAIQKLHYNIDIVAKSDAPVFIRGNSGTGKELVAEAIHEKSDRASKPFLKINCAAVPDTLFESTLFGHEKGSFSGAYKSKKGIFEEGDGGTLLLDEISEIPYNMQAKLLRVLQEMKIIRVGNTNEIPIDVRIIATSNRDIQSMIDEGKFREDLFFRLNVFPIETPDLNSLKEDIPLLVNHFLNKFIEKYATDKKTLTTEALNKLIEYQWPGNIRQLEHIIERAILYSAKKSDIDVEHLIFEGQTDPEPNDYKTGNELTTLAEMEKKFIFAALEKTDNHKTKAAELLGITVRTLRNKLHQFNEEEQLET